MEADDSQASSPWAEPPSFAPSSSYRPLHRVTVGFKVAATRLSHPDPATAAAAAMAPKLTKIVP